VPVAPGYSTISETVLLYMCADGRWFDGLWPNADYNGVREVKDGKNKVIGWSWGCNYANVSGSTYKGVLATTCSVSKCDQCIDDTVAPGTRNKSLNRTVQITDACSANIRIDWTEVLDSQYDSQGSVSISLQNDMVGSFSVTESLMPDFNKCQPCYAKTTEVSAASYTILSTKGTCPSTLKINTPYSMNATVQ
jgi:hypothetical protein